MKVDKNSTGRNRLYQKKTDIYFNLNSKELGQYLNER